jgi:signal transduction histidine kinase/CheY-like chemotaxis protein/HPt (histidine-containing phosphotransfer) domain-containing protein
MTPAPKMLILFQSWPVIQQRYVLKNAAPIIWYPHLTVYTDPNRQLTLAEVRDRFLRNDRPKNVSEYTIGSPSPQSRLWAVLPIYNVSYQSGWSLDFGDPLTGRGTTLTGLSVAELIGNRYLINQQPNTSNQTDFGSIIGIQLAISDSPSKGISLLVFTLDPKGDRPFVMPITLRPGVAPPPQNAIWQNPILYWTMAGILAGGFVFMAFLSGQPWMAAGALMALAMVAPLLGPTELISVSVDIPVKWPLLIYLTQSTALVCLLWAIGQKFSLSICKNLVLFGLLATQAGISTLVFMNSAAALWIFILIFAPAFLWAAIVVGLLSLTNFAAAVVLSMAIALTGLATGLQIMAEQNLVPASSFTLNAQVMFLVILVPLWIFSMTFIPIGNAEHVDVPRPQKADKDLDRLDRLRQVKESYDYNNLLKVIDHERKQLAAARTREMVRGEEMRKAKELADEANRAKSAFLAVISHEIRTPMTGILGMVKMLLDSTMSKAQSEYVQTIKESSNAMMGLLNDILDFEKIESGKMAIEKLDFDLHRLISGVMTLMNGPASNKGIDLLLDQDFSVPHFVVGDMTRLRQVLLNLVGNAIKFTHQGYVKVKISATTESNLNLEQISYQVYFAIEDTGIGISPEAQRTIFNPFSQADQTIARKFGGTGLGLAISKLLLEAMGSQINIKSREGDGTTFFFTLAMPEGHAARAEEISGIAPSPLPSNKQESPVERSLRILVVEDNTITQRVLQTLIEYQNHKPIILSSAEQALSFINMGEQFDLILTDIQMPGMNGLEFARHVRALNSPFAQSVPILALTGNIEADDIQECLQAGMNGHLGKPIDPDVLEKTLRDIAHAVPAALAVASSVTAPQKEHEFTNSGEIELELLGTLRESLGDAQLSELLRGLYDKTEEVIAALQEQGTRDLEFTRARAHEMKGMCGNFGLLKLAEISKNIEKQAKLGALGDIPVLIDQLPVVYRQGRREIDAWLAT